VGKKAVKIERSSARRSAHFFSQMIMGVLTNQAGRQDRVQPAAATPPALRLGSVERRSDGGSHPQEARSRAHQV